MDAAQALVTQIQGLSSSAGDISRLHIILKQAEEMLHVELARFFPALDQFDPSIHSPGYLYIVEACSVGTLSIERAGVLIRPISRFINACAVEEIRLAPENFISVCRRFKDIVMLLEAPMQGVAPMLIAVGKLQTSS